MVHEWNLPLWERLTGDLDRLPHALLLCGPAGIGKGPFSEALAARLLCEQARASGFACGQCAGCRWFAAGNHPDFRLIAPESEQEPQEQEADVGRSQLEPPAAKDRKPSTQILVEQVRPLGDFIALGTHRQGRRVVVIRPAEAMNAASANSLLKLLEEPTVNSQFILVSSFPARLLPTIRSRCQRVGFSKPRPGDASRWLAAQGVADPGAALSFCGGTPLAAAQFARSNLTRLWQRFTADLGNMHDCDPLAAAAAWETWLRPAKEDEPGLTLAELVAWMQKWVFDLGLVKATGRAMYHPGMEPGLQLAARAAAITDLFACYNDLLRAYAVAQHPLNARLFLEDLALRYARTICH